MTEFLDVVDRSDNVIGRASKEEVYRRALCHRIVHVLIFNDKGEMALQLRSPNISFCPGHWSTAVGGHVQSGETSEQAALREYKEELGAISKLAFFSKDFYHAPGTPDKFLITFKTRFNGPFKPDPDAVTMVEFFTLEDIKKMLEKGEKFHPELLFLLRKHFFLE